MKTVADIIADCGGPERIAEASNKTLSHWAVRKWPNSGIPEKNWAVVRSLTKISLEDLHAANEAARAGAAA